MPLQKLEPLRRELSEEILAEVSKKTEKSYRCLACLDRGEVQVYLLQKYEVVADYRLTDAPMLCRCGAHPNLSIECLDQRLSKDTCTTLHQFEVERLKEASAPSPAVVLEAIADLSASRTLKPLNSKERELANALGVDYDF